MIKKLLCLLTLCVSLNANQKLTDFEHIEFVNVSPEIVTDVKNKFSALKSDSFYAQLDEIIRYIHSKINYDIVSVSKNADKFQITIVTSTRIAEIDITGNSAISTSDLKLIASLNENDVLDTNTVLDAAERIRKAYNELGFLNTKVNVEVPEVEKNRVAIKMQVDEGAPTKIQEIKLSSENKEVLEKIQKLLAPFKTRPFTESTLYEMQKKVKDYFKENPPAA